MSNWYWSRERFTSSCERFLLEVVGLSRIESHFDPMMRVQKFYAYFYYCDLAEREERQAAIGYDVMEEELFMARDPEMIMHCMADRMLSMKRQYNDFSLNPDPDIMAMLEGRSCTEIRYFGQEDAYQFLDINGEQRGPVQPIMLKARIDYLAPLKPKYPSECMACRFLDKNPYLPCAINPMFATGQDTSYCKAYEPK